MNKATKNKTTKDLLEVLERLAFDANRVSSKFGTDEENIPSDWQEWINLRRSLMQARHALAREGIKLNF